jgi:preprotein translocase subunit SecD
MDAQKPKMVTEKMLLIAVVCLLAAGCKTARHFTGSSAVVVRVRVTTDTADKSSALEKAANIIRSKADALHLDVDVKPSPGESEVLAVTFYDEAPSAATKEILFKAHRLELKKAVQNGNPPIAFESEDTAKQNLKPDEEALPLTNITDDRPGKLLAVECKPVITGEDIRNAQVFQVRGMDPSVMVNFKPEGASKFEYWSTRNIGNYLAIVLDGVVLSYPVIKGKMSDSAMIEGRFTRTQAEDLALDLSAGYLEGTMTVVDEK